VRFDYPAQAKFGRVIPKSKIYEHARLSAALKKKFVDQIEKIVWSYKLSPETINLAATPAVPEIQIFDIYLKGTELSDDVLRTIDKAIPFPIIFQIHRANSVKVKAAYKRPSEADSAKWVIEGYVESEWLPEEDIKAPLPVALDLERLYELLLKALIPKVMPTLDAQGSMKEQMALIEAIKAKEREYEKLKAKRDREKQFNKKVKLNEKLHILKEEIERLSRENEYNLL